MILSRMILTFVGTVVIGLFLVGCGPSTVTQAKADITLKSTDQDASAVIPAHGLRLPATFRGDLPCADCEGVRYQLNLWPDQVFHLQRQWLDKDIVHSDIGRWRVDPSRRALVLQGGTEMPLQFEILGPDRLRQLDLAGKPIVSNLPYELRSKGTLEPMDVSLLLGGEMTYMADSPRFTECLTGRSYPIVPGNEALRLQRAYLADIKGPGAKLYVSFEGTITRHPAMEGDRLESAVTVERFISTWPAQACSRARANASLMNTYWRIVRMQGDEIKPAPGRREPHLLFRQSEAGPSYATTVDCNQLVGQLETTGEHLSFSRGAITLMACPPPLAGLEKQLGEVLNGTRRSVILGNTLSLQDEAGKELALFEAVYF